MRWPWRRKTSAPSSRPSSGSAQSCAPPTVRGREPTVEELRRSARAVAILMRLGGKPAREIRIAVVSTSRYAPARSPLWDTFMRLLVEEDDKLAAGGGRPTFAALRDMPEHARVMRVLRDRVTGDIAKAMGEDDGRVH